MKRAARVDIKNAEIVKREEYVRILESITKQGFCPFCEEHLMKHHQRPVLFKNADWLVTENSWPYEGTRHHFVLITRRHITDAAALKPHEWQSLGAAYKKLVKAYGLKGAALLMRSGQTSHTGASVAHLHAQLIAGSPRGKATEEIRALVGFKKKQ